MALEKKKGEWKVFADFQTDKKIMYGLYRLDENGNIEERPERYEECIDATKIKDYLNERGTI